MEYETVFNSKIGLKDESRYNNKELLSAQSYVKSLIMKEVMPKNVQKILSIINSLPIHCMASNIQVYIDNGVIIVLPLPTPRDTK